MTKTPKCPYCGDKMELMIVSPECIDGTSTAWYQCVACESSSPTSECPANSPRKEIVKKALALAMRRFEPKNRVLTLEESRNAEKDAFGNVMRWLEIHDIRKYAEFNHLENENGIFAASLWFDEETGEAATLALFSSAISSTVFLRQKEYGLCWRCWLRKPTDEEKDRTPWEK